jgi:hypothetical protein
VRASRTALQFRETAADEAVEMFDRKPPIRSTQEDVAELADQIDRFVIGLGERIDAIQDAELARASTRVSALARALSADAERLGYPGMALSAKGVAMAAEDDVPDELQETIRELTEIAQRVRRGHRGAA